MASILIEYTTAERIAQFLGYIQERIGDPIHSDHHDLIADFIDKFIVVELKRLEAAPESRQDQIVLSDEIVEAIRKGPGSGSTTPTVKAPATTAAPASKPPSVGEKPRNGNGHKREKKRDLTTDEKRTVRTEFIRLNGCIKEDDCVSIKKLLGSDIAIFQVNGSVSWCHHLVDTGAIILPDPEAYKKFMAENSLWGVYKREMRARMGIKEPK